MKKDLLKQANYKYSFDRDLYFNREAKKAFNIEFVDDKPEEALARLINENSNGNGWKFYFNSPPSEAVIRELESALA